MQEPNAFEPPSDAEAPSLEESRQEVLRIPLRPQPRIRPLLLAGLLTLAILLLSDLLPPLVANRMWDAVVLSVFAVLVVPLGLLLFGSKAPGKPVLEFSEDRMRLPITTRAQEFVTLRYREITQLFVRDGEAGFVWIGTPRGAFVYPTRTFPGGATQVAELLAHIEARLEPFPDWPKRKAAFQTQQLEASALYDNRLWGTKVLLAVFAVVFAVQSMLQSAGDDFAVVGLGANVPELVGEGQLYRLIVSNLLHVDPYHLIMNGVLILWLGGLVERLFGTRVFVLIALLAAVLGPAASAISAKASVSVGSSAIAFGMLGAFGFATFRLKGKLPLGVTPPLRLWITLGILLAFMGMMAFGTDFPNHLGGFLAGVLVAGVIIEARPELPQPRAASGPIGTALLAGLTLVVGGGLGWGATHIASPDPSNQTRALKDFLERQPANPRLLNRISWFIAMDPEAPADRLELARIASHRAVSNIKEPAERRGAADTVATVYYRLGRYDEAIDRELELLDAESDKTFATQLARFLRARLESEGVRVGEGLDPKVQAATRHHPSRGFGFDFDPALATEPPRTGWWLVESNGQLQGLLRLPLGPKVEPGRTLWLRSVGIEPVWNEGSVFRLAWVQAGHAPAAGWLMDAEVLEYP